MVLKDEYTEREGSLSFLHSLPSWGKATCFFVLPLASYKLSFLLLVVLIYTQFLFEKFFIPAWAAELPKWRMIGKTDVTRYALRTIYNFIAFKLQHISIIVMHEQERSIHMNPTFQSCCGQFCLLAAYYLILNAYLEPIHIWRDIYLAAFVYNARCCATPI